MERIILKDRAGSVLLDCALNRLPLRPEAAEETARAVFGPGQICFSRRAAAERLLLEQLRADAFSLGLGAEDRPLDTLPPDFLQAVSGAEKAAFAALVTD